jgi:DNA (cytosine-5)-methyltransferase 1
VKPRLLDLFCCAGGAGRGYADAGFEVTGVDIEPQRRYPYAFIQADVLSLGADFLRQFDAIHASPPCQAHTSMKTMHNAKPHLDLIEPTRALLNESGRPWIMENVVGAPLERPVLLCGTMFGLGVEDAELRRHRLFETSFSIPLVPECQHGSRDTIGVYGGHVRNRRRVRTIGIYGEGARDSRRKFDKGVPDFSVDQGREAMGCDWMTVAELSQAIPPAYTEWLGRQLLSHMKAKRLAA